MVATIAALVSRPIIIWLSRVESVQQRCKISEFPSAPGKGVPITAQFAQVAEIRQSMIEEIYSAIGLPDRSWLRLALAPIAWAPAHRFAGLIAECERNAERSGFRQATRQLMERFISGVIVRGEGNVPVDGPLLVASNHPGAVDGLAIAASLPRDDLKIVVSGSPFFQKLVYLREHLILTGRDPHGQMLVLRNAIRHLRDGGAVLLFPSGRVDPDPAVFHSASSSVDDWSLSVATLLEKVPAARLMVTVVSGVLAPECLNHPLVRLRKGTWEKRRLAEYIQIIQQLIFGRRYPLRPLVSFAGALTLSELRLKEEMEDAMGAVRTHTRRVMDAK